MRISTDWQRLQRYAFAFALIFAFGAFINSLAFGVGGEGAMTRLVLAVVLACGSALLWGYATVRRQCGEWRDLSRHDHRQGGFTLIEMLVVMSIVALVIGIGLPILASMKHGRGEAAAVTTVSTATNAARIMNQRIDRSDMGAAFVYVRDNNQVILDDSFKPDVNRFPPTAVHSGTAALFTPTGEIRLVINDQSARRTVTPAMSDYLEPDFNGYEDVDGMDYLSLPRSAGLVGVVRTGSGPNDLRVIAPPFAVRFNSNGHLAMDREPVIYDGDYDGFYLPSDARPVDYNPDDWQPQRDPDAGKYPLPFERIESVVAMIAFDMNTFRIEGPGWSGSDADKVAWMMEHGRAINFSPQSGLAITGE